MEEYERLSVNEARKLVKKWQHILRLDDWDIEVKVVHPSELPDHFGRSDFCEEKKSGRITLIDRDPQQDVPIEYNPEQTAVHELLHFHLEGNGLAYKEGSQKDIRQHIFIDQLSRVLVKLND